MKTIFETLEMNEIQRQVQGYCASTLGKKRVDNLVIFDDVEDLDEALEKVNEIDIYSRSYAFGWVK